MTERQSQQPTVEMRELGSAADNRALAGYLAGVNVDSWADLLLNHCAQRALTKGLMSIWKRFAVAYHQLLPCNTVFIHILDAGIGIMFYQICR